jgi:hypothetical protein
MLYPFCRSHSKQHPSSADGAYWPGLLHTGVVTGVFTARAAGFVYKVRQDLSTLQQLYRLAAVMQAQLCKILHQLGTPAVMQGCLHCMPDRRPHSDAAGGCRQLSCLLCVLVACFHQTHVCLLHVCVLQVLSASSKARHKVSALGQQQGPAQKVSHQGSSSAQHIQAGVFLLQHRCCAWRFLLLATARAHCCCGF